MPKKSEDPEPSKDDTEDEWIDCFSKDIEFSNLENPKKSWIE